MLRVFGAVLSLVFAIAFTAAVPFVELQIQDDAGSIRMGDALDAKISRTAGGDVGINTGLHVTGALSAQSLTVVDTVSSGFVSTGTITAASATLSGSIAASNIYSGSNVLNIPSQYATLSLAIAVLQRKVLTYVVTIRFADGTYNLPNFVLTEFPSPEMIRIIGNTANPNAVTLVQSTGGVALFQLFYPSGSGISFGWFRMVGAGTPGSVGFNACNAKLIVEGPVFMFGFYTALLLGQGAWGLVRQVTATGCGWSGMEVYESYADAIGISLSGVGSAAFAGVCLSGLSTVFLDGATVSGFGMGMTCNDGVKDLIYGSAGVTYSAISGTQNACVMTLTETVALSNPIQSVGGYQFRHRVIAAKYQSTSTVTLPNGSPTALDLATKVFDSQSPNLRSLALPPAPFTIPTSGYYSFAAMTCFAASAGTGDRAIYITRNGGGGGGNTFGYVNSNGSAGVCLRTNELVALSAGDSIHLVALQSTGAAVDTAVSPAGQSALITIHYIGE